MSNFFDDIGKFFDEFGGREGEDNAPDDDEADDPAGCSRIMSIPVESIKTGGLRLYLSLYLMGVQNNPEKGTWKSSQTDDTTIDMYYKDLSAALTIRLSEEMIAIDRLGSMPSTQFTMQESVILNGILDELQVCAFEGDINESDRLLVLPPPADGIDKARAALAFS